MTICSDNSYNKSTNCRNYNEHSYILICLIFDQTLDYINKTSALLLFWPLVAVDTAVAVAVVVVALAVAVAVAVVAAVAFAASFAVAVAVLLL